MEVISFLMPRPGRTNRGKIKSRGERAASRTSSRTRGLQRKRRSRVVGNTGRRPSFSLKLPNPPLVGPPETGSGGAINEQSHHGGTQVFTGRRFAQNTIVAKTPGRKSVPGQEA